MPSSIYSEKNKEKLFKYCFWQDKSVKILSQKIEKLDAALLFELNNEVYEFLMRSLINPKFVIAVSSLLVKWQKGSCLQATKQVHAIINKYNMNVAGFERGELLFANSFNFYTENEAIYYIMYICRQVGFNQTDDHLYLYGSTKHQESVFPLFKQYMKNAEYRVTPHKVDKFLMDMDIEAMKECEL